MQRVRVGGLACPFDSDRVTEDGGVMKSKNGWVLLVMLLSGIVLGGFIGMLTANVSGLSWLNYGQSFGLESPVVLDLGLLALTFGLRIQISIASIIGVVLAIIIYRKL